MILAIAIAAAVTFGLWSGFRLFHSRVMISSICGSAIRARSNPDLAGYSPSQIYSCFRFAGALVSAGVGLAAGLAAFGVGAIVVLASHV